MGECGLEQGRQDERWAVTRPVRRWVFEVDGRGGGGGPKMQREGNQSRGANE